MDRIDLYVDVESVNHRQLLATKSHEEKSEQIRKRIQKARKVQYERKQNSYLLNGSLGNRAIKQAAGMTPYAKELLDNAGESMVLSARAYMRAVKVARTIADLAGSKHITNEHVAEALQYRPRPTSENTAVVAALAAA
jgi:magnesium chelatase family protein